MIKTRYKEIQFDADFGRDDVTVLLDALEAAEKREEEANRNVEKHKERECSAYMEMQFYKSESERYKTERDKWLKEYEDCTRANKDLADENNKVRAELDRLMAQNKAFKSGEIFRLASLLEASRDEYKMLKDAQDLEEAKRHENNNPR